MGKSPRAPGAAVSLVEIAVAAAITAALLSTGWERSAGADMKESLLAVTTTVTNNCTVATGASARGGGGAMGGGTAMTFRSGGASLSVVCTRGAASNVRMSTGGALSPDRSRFGASESRYYFYTRGAESEVWGASATSSFHSRSDAPTVDAVMHGAGAHVDSPDQVVVATLEF